MIRTEKSDGKDIFFFDGRMDTATCAGVEKELDGQIEKAEGTVVFDLGSVDFVSSAFLRICIATAKKKGAGNLKVANAAPSIKKVFKIAGLDQFLM